MLKRIKMKYLTYVSLNMGGDHVSSLTEEDDSYRTIREVYKENNSDLGWLKDNRQLKRSTQRNLVDETSRSHRSFLSM